MKKTPKNIRPTNPFAILGRRFFALSAVRIYMSDVGVRQSIYLLRGLLFGMLYSAFNMFAAMLYESRWFAAVAVYYLLLVCTRYILYLTGKRHAFGERESASLYKSLRSVGIVMLMLNLAMASIIIYTIATERAKVHSPVVIYLFVVYTVSIFVFNAASLYINRKKRLPYSYLITRIISFCASMMSLFNLVNSLVFTLGIEKRLARVINAFVGGGVIFFVLFLCIAIIVKCNKRLRCCTPYEGDGKVAKS